MNNIRKLEITNDDYYGKLIISSKASFNSKMSNGVENQLNLVLDNGEKKSFYYELYNSDDLQKVKLELINYYLKGKLDFQNLVNILGIRKDSEILEFREEIKKRTANNTA